MCDTTLLAAPNPFLTLIIPPTVCKVIWHSCKKLLINERMGQQTQNWLFWYMDTQVLEANLPAKNPKIIPKGSVRVVATLHTPNIAQKEEERATYSCAGIVELYGVLRAMLHKSWPRMESCPLHGQ